MTQNSETYPSEPPASTGSTTSTLPTPPTASTPAPAMSPRAGLRNAVLFTLGMIGFYVLIGVYVQQLVGGGEAAPAAAAGIGPEAGEQIFWGKGKCSTCHSIGDRGSAVRCPNLGDIAVTAATRDPAKYKTATEYLVASLKEPSEYVVDGFSGDTMPKVYQPPISLSPDEVTSVISYLQTQGGAADVAAIHLPPEIAAAAAGGGGAAAPAWAPYMEGDAKSGETLFFSGRDGKGAIGAAPYCATCHMKGGKGNKVGPELDEIVATRGAAYVIKSILDPKAEIVANYPDVMPTVFATELSVRELHDIVAFLSQ